PPFSKARPRPAVQVRGRSLPAASQAPRPAATAGGGPPPPPRPPLTTGHPPPRSNSPPRPRPPRPRPSPPPPPPRPPAPPPSPRAPERKSILLPTPVGPYGGVPDPLPVGRVRRGRRPRTEREQRPKAGRRAHPCATRLQPVRTPADKITGQAEETTYSRPS